MSTILCICVSLIPHTVWRSLIAISHSTNIYRYILLSFASHSLPHICLERDKTLAPGAALERRKKGKSRSVLLLVCCCGCFFFALIFSHSRKQTLAFRLSLKCWASSGACVRSKSSVDVIDVSLGAFPFLVFYLFFE